jgi:hypothetical protein
VEITRAILQRNPTNNPAVKFVAAFSKPCVGFTSSDVWITAGGTGASGVTVNTHSPVVYNLTLTGISASGTVSVTIPAGACQDGSGNNNTASVNTGNSVAVDLVSPTTTGVTLNAGSVSPTGASVVHVAVSFSEAVTGVSTSSFNLTNSVAGALSASNLAGSGSGPYTFDVTGHTSAGTLYISLKRTGSGVQDPAQNMLASVGAVLIVVFGESRVSG